MRCFFYYGGLGLLLAGSSPAQAQCRDAWLTQIYRQLYRRLPVGQDQSCECNPRLYHGGRWASYDELVSYVRQLQDVGLRFGYAPLGLRSVMAVARAGRIEAVVVLDTEGRVVGRGGASLRAAGGAALLAAGGRTLQFAPGPGSPTGLSAHTPGFVLGPGAYLLASSPASLATP